MAVFKIIASRPIKKKDYEHHPELDVEMISGELKVDDRFIIYETHHPFEIIIRKLEKKGAVLTLSISCPVRYEGWHVGTIVDTDHPESGRKFGYRTKDAKRLYHSDVLKGNDGSNSNQ